MGVPRNPIQLVGDAFAPRVVAVADQSDDYTERLNGYAGEVAPTLVGVHGYIFADRSPSCGLAGVKVFAGDGSYRRSGRGVYAAAVVAANANLPAVDAQTLADEDVFLGFATSVVLCSGTPVGEGHNLRGAISEFLNTL